jgi:hypothetical protein
MIGSGIVASSNGLTAKVPGETFISLSWNPFNSAATLFFSATPPDNSEPVSFFTFEVYDQGVLWYSSSAGGPTGLANITLNPYSFGTIVGRAHNSFGSGPETTISWTGGFS